MLQSSDKIAAAEPDPKPEKVLVAGTRVDGAHLVRDAQPSDGAIDEGVAQTDDTPAPAGAVAAGSSLEAVQLQAQAEQLGQHLRQRQDELDRRTAQLNARLAELDQEVRNARLWLSEQQAAIAERETSVTARERELADKLAQAAAADQTRHDESRALVRREAQLALREQELAGQPNIRHAEGDAPPGEQDRAFQARQEELSLREQRLQQAETLLLAGQAEVVEMRRQLDQRREQLEAQARFDRRRLAETQRLHEAQLAQKRQAIEQQAQRVDHRQTAVERSRLELTRLQREAIETRLATEELQAQLAGALAPAAWERSLAALRQRFTECYRLETATLAEQRTELETLKAELAAEHDKLELRHREIQTWAGARHAELQQQARRLEAREQELVRQQTAWQEQEQLWREERFIQQQQLRQLLADRRPLVR
jgi:hypothetical protein